MKKFCCWHDLLGFISIFAPVSQTNNIPMAKNLNRIKAVLADKQRTNKWLAEQLDKDPATVSKWCTNSCQPSIETLMQIARLLDVQVDDLLRLEEMVEMEGTRVMFV